MKSPRLLVLFTAALISPLTFADATVSDSATQALIERSAKPALINSDNQKTLTQYETVTAKVTPLPESTILPFWGDEARARGYELPLPFGVSISHMNIRQNIDVDSITFSGLSLGSHPLPSSLFNINVDKTRQQSNTDTLRLDMWLLPFMNVYGIVGKTRGSSLSNVSVDSDPSNYKPGSMDWLIAKAVQGMHDKGQLQNIDFKLEFKGTTYGIGTTFAGGYDNWFTTLDMNYTQTSFDILDGKIDAFTLSPRVGYRFAIPAIDVLHMAPSKLNVWVGSMYQNVQQEFKGSLSDLNMPPDLAGLIQTVDRHGQGRFDVKQHLESPWNVLLGAQYEVTQNFNLITEFGFAQRNSFFVSAEYRF
ncbi:Uncharacterised protein [Yersinia aldovae]|uniref:lipoprotein n=1 Tax=Yersinia aldovae TaxID=29483 RepID=UPI0005E0D523|nr:lipoprotein [Yersinia aldovae]CNI31944.1 Uncharacterised protein [Yersinia aldovae]